jgi:hypothetical protein
MHPSTTLLATLLLATFTTALPKPYNNTTTPINFLLLTTPSSQHTLNTSSLPSVSATSLFDPLANPTYLLRLIGVGEFEYNSTRVRAGEDLMFSSDAEEGKAKGNLGLKDGFLLTVGGEAVGWKICDGELGQRVVSVIFLLG